MGIDKNELVRAVCTCGSVFRRAGEQLSEDEDYYFCDDCFSLRKIGKKGWSKFLSKVEEYGDSTLTSLFENTFVKGFFAASKDGDDRDATLCIDISPEVWAESSVLNDTSFDWEACVNDVFGEDVFVVFSSHRDVESLKRRYAERCPHCKEFFSKGS